MIQPGDVVLAEFVGTKRDEGAPTGRHFHTTLSPAPSRPYRRATNDPTKNRQYANRLHLARLASSRTPSTQRFSCLPRHGSC
jgi:hypothetical protein